MRPPICDVCGRRRGQLQTLQFADYEPLPDGMVGHPTGLHWVCERHHGQLVDLTHLPWEAALASRGRRGRGDAP